MNNQIPFPFTLKHISQKEKTIRDIVLDAFPSGMKGIELTGFSELFEQENLHLCVSKLLFSPTLKGNGIFAAVSCTPFDKGKSVDCYNSSNGRAVIALSPQTADRMISAVLGRMQTETVANEISDLSQGELGALMFALNEAGKDWLTAGGKSFYFCGFLHDMDQAVDYLGHFPELEIEAEIKSDNSSNLLIRLWCNIPQKPYLSSPLNNFFDSLSWQVRFALCAGFSILPISDVQNLRPGDIIIMDEWNHPLKKGNISNTLFLCGKRRLAGRYLSETEIKITEFGEKELTMTNNKSIDSIEKEELKFSLSDSNQIASKEMEVSVRVEIGEIKMSVNDALNLKPGRIVKLDRPVTPKVNVFVGEKFIAEGIIVEVDNVLAVEITEC